MILAGHSGSEATAQQALDDPSPRVRCAALSALDRLGALDTAQLEAGLRDASPMMRACAAELAAHHTGVDLYDLLADDDSRVTEAAAWACGERPTVPGRVVSRLCEVTISHADALCREAAVAALGALGDEAGLGAILAATRDRATVRRRAVLALAGFSGPEVDEALARAGEDRDWQVRQAAEDLR